jgi:hypothetical protein
VHVVNKKNAFDLCSVNVDLHYDGLIAVTAGLRADDWVVAEAAEPQLE